MITELLIQHYPEMMVGNQIIKESIVVYDVKMIKDNNRGEFCKEAYLLDKNRQRNLRKEVYLAKKESEYYKTFEDLSPELKRKFANYLESIEKTSLHEELTEYIKQFE